MTAIGWESPISDTQVESNNIPPSLNLDIPMPTCPREHAKQPDEAEIIDVDTFEYENILKQPNSLVRVCEGYTMTFPDGKSPHPFALHNTIILPWDYALKNGIMKLFAHDCHGLSEGLGTACQPCQRLIKNERFSGRWKKAPTKTWHLHTMDSAAYNKCFIAKTR